MYTIRECLSALIFQWFSAATLAKLNVDEPRKAPPESGREAHENFPIREPGENFCIILPSFARVTDLLEKLFLLLRKIPHCYISEPIEPPEYHRLS